MSCITANVDSAADADFSHTHNHKCRTSWGYSLFRQFSILRANKRKSCENKDKEVHGQRQRRKWILFYSSSRKKNQKVEKLVVFILDLFEIKYIRLNKKNIFSYLIVILLHSVNKSYCFVHWFNASFFPTFTQKIPFNHQRKYVFI